MHLIVFIFLSVMETDQLQQCSVVMRVQQHPGSQSSCLQLHNLLMDIDLAAGGAVTPALAPALHRIPEVNREQPSFACFAGGEASSCRLVIWWLPDFSAGEVNLVNNKQFPPDKIEQWSTPASRPPRWS